MINRAFAISMLLSFCGCQPRDPQQLEYTPEELGTRLLNGDVQTRRDAAFSLSRLAIEDIDRAKPIRLQLEKALSDADIMTQIFSAHALADMGDASKRLQKVYDDAMANELAWARIQSCCGVRKNRQLLDCSSAVLGKGLKDKDIAVAQEAVCSLSKTKVISDPGILRDLMELARQHKDMPTLQANAFHALGQASVAHARLVIDGLATIDCHRSEHFDTCEAKSGAITALARRTEIK